MDKVLGMLGLAKRAGKVITGSFLCEKAAKDGSAKLILIAEDISDNGKKAIVDCCEHYHVKYIIYSNKDGLGNFTGSSQRAVVAVLDRGFANAVLDKYRQLFG